MHALPFDHGQPVIFTRGFLANQRVRDYSKLPEVLWHHRGQHSCGPMNAAEFILVGQTPSASKAQFLQLRAQTGRVVDSLGWHSASAAAQKNGSLIYRAVLPCRGGRAASRCC